MQLSRFCHARLEEAERRIEILNERGELKPAPAAFGPTTPSATEISSAPARTTWDAEVLGVSLARAQVDEALERHLPRPPACPAIVSDAMRYSVFAGGKRLRPMLALAADAVARPSARRPAPSTPQRIDALALPAACAVELIHTYSLIHDDLPAMDNDTYGADGRRCTSSTATASPILAGDGLQAEAFALLAREPAGKDPALVARKLRRRPIVAVRLGPRGMVGGQAIDLQAAGQTRRGTRSRSTPTACAPCTRARPAR